MNDFALESTSTVAISKALAAAQRDITAPKKGRTAKVPTKDGRAYEYSYADLADIIECLREPFAKHGLSHSEAILPVDGHLVLVTTVRHESGEWIRSYYPIATYQRPQETGSAVTYGRRYSLSALAGIAAEDDDDGAAAQDATPKQEATKPAAKVKPATNGETITREQIEQIHSAAKKAGMKSAQELAPVLSRILVGVEKASDIPSKDFRVVLDALEGMGRRAEVPA